jgi:uncharacterized membrane protein YfcA
VPHDLLRALAIFAVGLAAGTINTVVGSGTLITFPTLLAFGYPPVLANVSNNVGLVPGVASGVYGYRSELGGQRRRLIRLGSASVCGGLVGAILLLTLPQSAFKAIVPALIGVAVVMVIIQPRLAKWVAERQRARAALARPDGAGGTGAGSAGGASVVAGIDGASVVAGIDGASVIAGIDGARVVAGIDGARVVAGIDGASVVAGIDGARVVAGIDDARVVAGADGAGAVAVAAPPAAAEAIGGPVLWVLVFLAGIYGGYFGAAQGVLLIGMLGIALNDSLQRINAAKNVLAGLVNGLAAVVFILATHIDWGVAGLIAAGSIIGGQVGARIGKRLPPWGLRVVIVCVGTVALVKLLT